MQTQLVEKPKDDEVRNYGMLIGGEWVDARSGKTFESINPYTGRVWATASRRGTRSWMPPLGPPAKLSMRARGGR